MDALQNNAQPKPNDKDWNNIDPVCWYCNNTVRHANLDEHTQYCQANSNNEAPKPQRNRNKERRYRPIGDLRNIDKALKNIELDSDKKINQELKRLAELSLKITEAEPKVN